MACSFLFSHSLGGSSFVHLENACLDSILSHVEATSGISREVQRLACMGRPLHNESQLQSLLSANKDLPFVTIQVNLRLLGGKGGFGSLLRSQKSTKKTTNFSACRDRNGNRLRDVEIARRIAEHERMQREQTNQPVVEEKAPEPAEPVVDHEALKKEKKYQETRKEILTDVVSSVSEGYRMASQRRKQEQAMKRKRADEEIDALWTGDMEEGEGDEKEVDEKEREEQKTEEKEMKQQFYVSDTNVTTNTTTATTTTTTTTLTTATPDLKPIDIESAASLEALEAFGMEALKAELVRRGMKCGGTLRQRAERLWSVKSLKPEEIDPSLLATGTQARPSKRRKH